MWLRIGTYRFFHREARGTTLSTHTGSDAIDTFSESNYIMPLFLRIFCFGVHGVSSSRLI